MASRKCSESNKNGILQTEYRLNDPSFIRWGLRFLHSCIPPHPSASRHLSTFKLHHYPISDLVAQCLVPNDNLGGEYPKVIFTTAPTSGGTGARDRFSAVWRAIPEQPITLGNVGERRNSSLMGWLLLPICSLVLVALSPLCFAADVATEKNVLVLHSFSQRESPDDTGRLKSTVRSHISVPVNFQIEYLESQRFTTGGYEKGLTETLGRVYRGEKIDVVVVYAYPALRFALDHREEVFPGVPIVFAGLAPGRIRSLKLPPGVTGVTNLVDVRGTLDLALSFHPNTRNVAVVSGTSEFEQYWLAATNQEVRQHKAQLKLINLVGLPQQQLMKQIGELPPQTVIFFELVPLESSQPVLGTYDILRAISQRFPTYCIHDYCLNYGAVGGSYAVADEQRIMAGELAARILSGEKPESIPVMHGSQVHASVDWRQLRRWNIPESALPPGTIILYRQPTVWEKYERYIVAGIVLIVVQALLIAGLVWQRARKRKTEASLRESEKRFRVMADTTPSLVWMCDKEGKVTFLNDRRINFTGRDMASSLADAWTADIHPDNLQDVLATNERALQQHEGFSREYRLRRRDGVYRWIFDVAAPRINSDGTFAGFIGSAHDVTDQKMAQEALETVGGRLIEAQEKERSRIARELHDDICQRLSLLSLELEQANRASSGSDAPANARIEELRQDFSDLAGDVQALSHQLHSSKLDYLGLVAAVRSFCKEFAAQQEVNVEFSSENVPNPLPRDVSLCLFRVVQEALNNALKYSGVSRFSVALRGSGGRIQLEVRDSGVGFDVEKGRQDRGLGLVSMQERVHLLKGTFSIESRTNHGTRIMASVPLMPGLTNPAAGTATI
jgi:PAS domain S-box-containing protein